ncbi:hypothetical protein D3Z38_09725 [Clostridiales bacterium]|jgi:hypothetical protein|nr:hypothetical protein [Clostridiales bacterium]
MPNNKHAPFTRVMIFMILITVLAWLSAAEPARAAAMPGIEAKVTKKNILTILNKYDPDGAYVIKKQLDKGDNILRWYIPRIESSMGSTSCCTKKSMVTSARM